MESLSLSRHCAVSRRQPGIEPRPRCFALEIHFVLLAISLTCNRRPAYFPRSNNEGVDRTEANPPEFLNDILPENTAVLSPTQSNFEWETPPITTSLIGLHELHTASISKSNRTIIQFSYRIIQYWTMYRPTIVMSHRVQSKAFVRSVKVLRCPRHELHSQCMQCDAAGRTSRTTID